MENPGIISVTSAESVPATVEKFLDAAKQAGLSIFGQRDYTKSVGEENSSRPAVLILFGHPKVMQRLIAAKQQIALDLPMKAVVWEDANGKTAISYNDPRWLISRHGLSDKFAQLSNTMAAVIDKVTKSASSHQEIQ